MLPPETIPPFFAAACLLALTPGPDNLFVLTQSTIHGKAAGLIITLGLCTGLVAHTLAVALGVAAVIQASATAFTVLKSVGAAYLLYLAWLSFRAKPDAACGTPENSSNKRRFYRRGVAMNLSNPKVALFFLAFLPQFADPRRGSMEWQLILLGGLFIGATILVFGGIALLAGAMNTALSRSSSAQSALNKGAGIVFAALAIRLMITGRE